MDDLIITTINILQEINYQKPHHSSDPHRLYCIKYQITIAHSTPITHIIVFYCCYLCLLNSTLSFLHKSIILKSVFHFQTKDNDMHAYAHSWSSNDGHRN